MDYLYYISGTYFYTFHATSTLRMVDYRWNLLFNCLFRTCIYTTITTAALSDYCQKDVIIESKSLNFIRFQ